MTFRYARRVLEKQEVELKHELAMTPFGGERRVLLENRIREIGEALEALSADGAEIISFEAARARRQGGDR
jgi:hypothetical protein